MKRSNATPISLQQSRYALLLGSLFILLLAPAAKAQNSYNRWTAQPPAAIEPLQKKQRAPKPQAPAFDTTEAPRVAQSKLLKRGLGSRMRQGQSLPEDSISMVFFSQNSRYPAPAVQARAEAKVVIRLQVAPNGRVSRTSVVALTPAPSPYRDGPVPAPALQALADEAQRVFRMLRFEPGPQTSEEDLSANFSIQ
jgi:hypothetical protein